MRKLQVNILGKYQKIRTALYLRFKVRGAGVHLHKVQHYSWDHSEIIVSGESENLWKFIKTMKAPSFFLKLDKIVFTFIE